MCYEIRTPVPLKVVLPNGKTRHGKMQYRNEVGGGRGEGAVLKTKRDDRCAQGEKDMETFRQFPGRFELLLLGLSQYDLANGLEHSVQW